MIVEKPNVFLLLREKCPKFGSKKWIVHIIMYRYMTAYDYVIMIRVDACIIVFHLDCSMQMK